MGDAPKKLHCCPYEGCKSTFNRPYRLAQHLLFHNNVKGFVCPEDKCSKSYTSKSHLDRHINSVHKDPEKDVIYSCPTCMNKYANRQNLKRHIKMHHMLEVPFSCDTCKLEFRKKHYLSTHMYGHTGIKAFSCDICSEEFVSLFEKKKHARTHKTFTCGTCFLKFNQWSKYQKHLKSEHVNKEFCCNECGRKFKQRSHIVRHVKTHDITKSFPCPYENCKRFYSRNSNLKQHVLIKHEKLTHYCKVCDAQLCTKAKLREHLLKLHGTSEAKKIPKTKSTGRKPRKDVGTTRVSMALKLAGLHNTPDKLCETQAHKLLEVPVT